MKKLLAKMLAGRVRDPQLTPEQQEQLAAYNKQVELHNRSVDKVHKAVRDVQKKRAEAFDLQFCTAIKSHVRYFHHKNVASEYEPVFMRDNNKTRDGFKTIDLKKVRKKLKRDQIDYEALSIYELRRAMG